MPLTMSVMSSRHGATADSRCAVQVFAEFCKAGIATAHNLVRHLFERCKPQPGPQADPWGAGRCRTSSHTARIGTLAAQRPAAIAVAVHAPGLEIVLPIRPADPLEDHRGRHTRIRLQKSSNLLLDNFDLRSALLSLIFRRSPPAANIRHIALHPAPITRAIALTGIPPGATGGSQPKPPPTSPHRPQRRKPRISPRQPSHNTGKLVTHRIRRKSACRHQSFRTDKTPNLSQR